MFDSDFNGKITQSEWYDGWMVADLRHDWSLSRADFGFFFNVYSLMLCEDPNHRSYNGQEKYVKKDRGKAHKMKEFGY